MEFEISSYFKRLYPPKKVRRAYSMGALDAPVSRRISYIEKIKLASKLRKLH